MSEYIGTFWIGSWFGSLILKHVLPPGVAWECIIYPMILVHLIDVALFLPGSIAVAHALSHMAILFLASIAYYWRNVHSITAVFVSLATGFLVHGSIEEGFRWITQYDQSIWILPLVNVLLFGFLSMIAASPLRRVLRQAMTYVGLCLLLTTESCLLVVQLTNWDTTAPIMISLLVPLGQVLVIGICLYKHPLWFETMPLAAQSGYVSGATDLPTEPRNGSTVHHFQGLSPDGPTSDEAT